MVRAASCSFGRMSLDPIGHQEVDLQAAADEFELLHVIEQRAERVPEALDIGDQDRLLVAAELRPGELLDQLLQRADAARQRHEGVGALEHDALALVHVAGDDPLLHARQHVLAVDQEVRNDAGHHPAMVEDGDSASAPIRPTEPPP